MATEKLSGGNLGPVLEAFGGKSLTRIVAVGGIIFGCGLIANTLISVLCRPESPGPILVVFVLSVGFALSYVNTSWGAGLAKFEVCAGGVRLLRRDGATELPWARILKVKVGRFKTSRGWREHVVIRTTDGKDIEFPYRFWPSVGTERLATTMRRFVEDVEDDVDFSSAEVADGT